MNIVPFQFETKSIRTLANEQGEPWFVLRDVLEAMGTSTPTAVAISSVEQGLGNGFNVVIPITDSMGREQSAIIVAEAAVTYLLSRSNTEQGRKLNRFIHVEVLPAIRKTGTYAKEPQAALVLRTATDMVALAHLFGLTGNDRVGEPTWCRPLLVRPFGEGRGATLGLEDLAQACVCLPASQHTSIH